MPRRVVYEGKRALCARSTIGGIPMRFGAALVAAVMAVAVATPTFADQAKPISQNEASKKFVKEVLFPFALPSAVFIVYMATKNKK
jgi:hypothetical protein